MIKEMSAHVEPAYSQLGPQAYSWATKTGDETRLVRKMGKAKATENDASKAAPMSQRRQ